MKKLYFKISLRIAAASSGQYGDYLKMNVAVAREDEAQDMVKFAHGRIGSEQTTCARSFHGPLVGVSSLSCDDYPIRERNKLIESELG